MSAIVTPPLDVRSLATTDNAHALEGLTKRQRRKGSVLALVGLGAVSLLAGALSASVNRKPKNKLWYRSLRKPSFTPPDAVFAMVWPALYAGAAYSAYRVWKTPSSSARTTALVLWGTQLACNAAWSPLFFGAHKPRAAMVDLGGNFAALSAYASAAGKVDRTAAALVTPYLGWLGFAALMNRGIIQKNRWRF